MKEKHCKIIECVKISAYKKNLMRLNIKHIDLFGGGTKNRTQNNGFGDRSYTI